MTDLAAEEEREMNRLIPGGNIDLDRPLLEQAADDDDSEA